MSSPFRIGLIIGSTRPNRIAPSVTTFITSTLASHLTPTASIHPIDLVTFNLPLFNETILPQHAKSAADYSQPHTREWSNEISTYDAFIFLSAQRNWGIPAELKNAVDYLFHEWKGKPAGLVTYGGHGGTQCCDQLRIVLGAIGMKVLERQVNMKFPKGGLALALKGEGFALDASDNGSVWAEHREEFVALYKDIVEKLVQARDEKEKNGVL